MKKAMFVVITLAILIAMTGCNQDAASFKPCNGKGHRLLVGGCHLGYVGIVENDGSFIWKMDEKREVSDAWLLANGNILMTYKHGVKEITPDYASGSGATDVWDRPTPDDAETHGCQPLANGGILVGESYQDVSYLIELDKDQNETKRITLKNLGGKHTTFRQVRKTNANTYLITRQNSKGSAMEFDADGNVIAEFGDGRYVAIRLDNGNTLIACGDLHRAIEVDPQGKTVWQINQNDLPGISLGFVASMSRLPNGNTIITNWGGHGGSKGAAIIEVTPDKKVVWQSASNIINRVSSIQVVDNNKASKQWR